MIKLYGLEQSFPVNRVRLCLNAMKLEYEFIRIRPFKGENKTKDYLKINPGAKIPAIDDDGFTLFESNAIMKYLCRKYNSDYYPEDVEAQAHVDKWLDYIAIHLGNGFGKVLFNKFLAKIVGAEVDERSLQDGYNFIERYLGIIDKQLATSLFVAGNTMTIADFCLLSTIDPSEAIEINITDYPGVNAWRTKLMQESFYKKMHNSFGETLDKLKPLLDKK